MWRQNPRARRNRQRDPAGLTWATRDAGAEGDFALGLTVQLRQDAASVWGERGQHFTVTGMGRKHVCDFRVGQLPPNCARLTFSLETVMITVISTFPKQTSTV